MSISDRDNLDRILSFFPRVDSKASILFGVEVGMLAILFVNAPPMHHFTGWMIFSVVTLLVFITISLWKLYQCTFPQLNCGKRSLVYFGEIAKLTEEQFKEKWHNQNQEEQADDILGQIWRNSKILSYKFECLKNAFLLFAAAIIPWVMSLFLFVSSSQGKLLKL